MRMRRLNPLLLATAMIACSGSAEQPDPSSAGAPSGAAAAQDCKPLETRDPNARDQKPAFAGQTRACAVTTNTAFDVTVVARGLASPWSVEPLPGGDLLVTERPGNMRIVSAAGEIGAPIRGLPAVHAQRQGGLLDAALSPAFASDRTIYWSFSEPRSDGNGTSVARGVLSQDRTSLSDVRVIYRSVPSYTNSMHYGSRLAFGPDGKLYITMGERSDTPMRRFAQQKDSHLGKVVRINPDGSAPADNPFVGQQGALPEIWTMGHRNVQASAFDPSGRLWIVEHGTNGGDELNLIEKGNNYGWPLQAYGVEYSGQPIGSAETARDGMTQPVYYWDPVIAPSGAQFYTGSAFPAWQGNLFIGSLRDMKLVRVVMRDNRVTGVEDLLTDRKQRVRDVRQGPDGALYIVTDQENGELWRISPRG
ncbi:MAG TPA: PQQ-dependent sugar dehydrogenase [Longimicrobiales bacterium]